MQLVLSLAVLAMLMFIQFIVVAATTWFVDTKVYIFRLTLLRILANFWQIFAQT